MSQNEMVIATLKMHKENLESAKTFEEYKQMHIIYIEHLIALAVARKASNDATLAYAEISVRGPAKPEN